MSGELLTGANQGVDGPCAGDSRSRNGDAAGFLAAEHGLETGGDHRSAGRLGWGRFHEQNGLAGRLGIASAVFDGEAAGPDAVARAEDRGTGDTAPVEFGAVLAAEVFEYEIGTAALD